MAPERTLSRKTVQQLIFCGEENSSESIDTVEELEEERQATVTGEEKRLSAYVVVFEEVVATIVKNEHILLSDAETELLEQFGRLSYNTRYCLIKLTLRKANQWHPVAALESYKKEVGEDGLKASLGDLCKPISSLMSQTTITSQYPSQDAPLPTRTPAPFPDIEGRAEPEVIDLTLDDDEEEPPAPAPANTTQEAEEAAPAHTTQEAEEAAPALDPIQALLQAGDGEGNLEFFCEDETKMSLNEALHRLTVDKLDILVKQFRCKPARSGSWNKPDKILALKNHASGQGVLSFNSTPKKKVDKKNYLQTKLPFAAPAKANQEERLRDMALKQLGKCVRVNHDLFRLVRRLHIMYYRGMEHPESGQLFLNSLLKIFKKRTFTGYRSKRSNNIWSSREELLEYERALELSHLLDEIINEPTEKEKEREKEKEKEKQGGKTPARPKPKFKTPSTPGPAPRSTSTPLKPRQSQTPDIRARGADENADDAVFDGVNLVSLDVAEIRKEVRVKEHLEAWILPNWKDLVDKKRDEGGVRDVALERFEPGYVYTQMVWKASNCLGPLQEYDLELSVLEALLSQRFWSRGKRGKWYERRVIVRNHLKKKHNGDKDGMEKHQHETMEGLKEALSDSDTGLVYRPGFVDRLLKLEQQLKISEHLKTKCDAKLKEATRVEFSGKKLDSLRVDKYGNPIPEKENTPGLHSYNFTKKNASASDTPKTEAAPARKAMGKSRWQGKDGTVVNVETLALEFYEKQGYKGMHAETRLITTIFGMLMWDIIFMDKPGAFETDFQSCPLDMFEDSFYFAREAEIEARVEEIKNGKALEILERHDGWYREKKTWCVCVSWDLCTKEDLAEIIECFEKNSLAQICKIMCQDYKGRSTGGPDLFLWNPQAKKCKFVEVKGPGDSARPNQKLWFDALVHAGVNVEICWVLDANQPKATPASASRKRKSKSQTPKPSAKRAKPSSEEESFSSEMDYDLLDPEPEDQMPQLEMAPAPAMRRRISAPN